MDANIKFIILFGIFAMAFFPVFIFLIMITKRRMQKKDSEVETQNEATNQEKTKEEKIERQDTEWERNQDVMTCLRLTVGDTYQCMLTDLEKFQVGSKREWKSTEAFVGTIDDNKSVFTAKKIGSTYIECSDLLVYYIEIMPKYKWFAQEAYDAICIKKDVTIETMAQICKRIKSRVGKNHLEIHVDYDSNKSPCRILFRLKHPYRISANLFCGLRERMEMLAEEKGIQYWIHKTGQHNEEVVDYAAFVNISDEENIIFGIGQNWRQGGNSEEFKANASMFLHTFKNFLNANELPPIAAINDDMADLTIREDEIPTEEELPAYDNTNLELIEETEMMEEEQEVVISEDTDWDKSLEQDQFVDEDFLNEERELSEI